MEIPEGCEKRLALIGLEVSNTELWGIAAILSDEFMVKPSREFGLVHPYNSIVCTIVLGTPQGLWVKLKKSGWLLFLPESALKTVVVFPIEKSLQDIRKIGFQMIPPGCQADEAKE